MNNFICWCLNLTENKHRNELPDTAIIALLRRPGKARCVHRGEEFQLCNYRNKFATLITTGTLCSTSTRINWKERPRPAGSNGKLSGHHQAIDSKYPYSLLLLYMNYDLKKLCYILM